MHVNEKMTAIANAIRSKTGGTSPLTLDQMAQQIDGLSIGGVDSHAAYYANQITFNGSVFPENYDFVLHLRKAQTPNMTFIRSKNLKSVKLIADNTDGTIDLYQLLRECAIVETLDLTQYSRKPTTVGYLALASSNFKSIYGALDFSQCTVFSQWLNGALEFQDIEIVPGTIKASFPIGWCANLTDASIQSIIDGLADLTGAEAQTVTFAKAVGNKLTDEQKATISAKNWTLAY